MDGSAEQVQENQNGGDNNQAQGADVDFSSNSSNSK